MALVEARRRHEESMTRSAAMEWDAVAVHAEGVSCPVASAVTLTIRARGNGAEFETTLRASPSGAAAAAGSGARHRRAPFSSGAHRPR